MNDRETCICKRNGKKNEKKNQNSDKTQRIKSGTRQTPVLMMKYQSLPCGRHLSVRPDLETLVNHTFVYGVMK